MIKIIDHSKIGPKNCQARLFLVDALTGEPLNNWKPPFKKNMASPLAGEVAARLFGGEVGYQPARIEWGTGGVALVGAPMDEINPDLETPFSPTRMFTSLAAPEFPGTGVVRLLSFIDSTFADVGTPIQEVGIRTLALPGYPDGILIARYQEPSPINLSSTRVRIGVEWIYIYA